jgi:CRP-like cAMP-binding protein/uncharacterized protein (DUF2249 family)
MKSTQLDVRGLPVWERPQRVLDLLDTLPEDGSILIVTENEPRGFVTKVALSAHSDVVIDRKRVGEREWHVQIRRIAGNGEDLTPAAVLKRVAEFSDLPAEALTALALRATVHSARRGQHIAVEHSQWPYLGVVFEGAIALSSGDGAARQRIFYDVFPFEVFGEAEFFDGGTTAGRFVALSKTVRYLRIPREVVLETGMLHPKLLFGIGEIVVQRKRELMQSLREQASTPILPRIAGVLLPYALPDRGLSPALPPLPNMTQAQIAASAGTVKEVAARAIAELEQRHLLKRERGHIRFLDRQGLVDLVNATHA